MLRKSELIGFQAPGSTTRVIVTLFADDTTVYLNKSDDFNTLLGILQKWCSAAAKFNINKTEIIPIGPENYHRELINTRKLNINQDPINWKPEKMGKDTPYYRGKKNNPPMDNNTIIAHHAQPNPVAKPAAKLNIFLQTWKPTSKKLQKNIMSD
ncbi:hypothetical protein BDZ94DRAFT_1241828 [Collybia nuda]|uniref:Reverse transcriptase domain-containing protein n=1 Tax=Collybia nuda TaxID=64659 RepID=A0A9P6CCI3_9AGAR|nr:hypothetical protein BDZ94DRAFT_1241828 [Collybia nuda]